MSLNLTLGWKIEEEVSKKIETAAKLKMPSDIKQLLQDT